MMIVAVAPEESSCHESLCSLRFAQKVSQVELGKVQKNVSSSNNTNNTNSSSSSNIVQRFLGTPGKKK